MSNEVSRPFLVYPDESTKDQEGHPLRFDPNEWYVVGTKSYGDQWNGFDGFYHYTIEEALYHRGKSWVVITHKSHFDLGDTEQPTFKKLTIEQAAEWFIDCESTPPIELERILKEKSLSPEPVWEAKRLPELKVEVFVEFWYTFAQLWNQIISIGGTAKESQVPLSELNGVVLDLVRTSQEYSGHEYSIWSTSFEWDSGRSATPFGVLKVHLLPPYDSANELFCEMFAIIQGFVNEMKHHESEYVTSDLAFYCALAGKKPYLECHRVIREIHSTRDASICKYLHQRAIDQLSNNGVSQQDQSVSPTPSWDGRKLVLDGIVVTEYRRPAKNQKAIIESFQQEGWPERILDPLPFPSDSQKLRETVADLNGRQNVLEFLCDGTGGVLWRMRGACADEK